MIWFNVDTTFFTIIKTAIKIDDSIYHFINHCCCDIYNVEFVFVDIQMLTVLSQGTKVSYLSLRSAFIKLRLKNVFFLFCTHLSDLM